MADIQAIEGPMKKSTREILVTSQKDPLNGPKRMTRSFMIWNKATFLVFERQKSMVMLFCYSS